MSNKKIEDVIEEIDVTLDKNDKNDEVNEFIVLTDKIKELEEKNLRIMSEFQNYKRRTEEERMNYIQNANGYLISNLLPVIDDLERALSSNVNDEFKGFLEGFKLIHDNMLSIFKNEGLKEIDALGNVFDPNLHQAVVTDNKEDVENDIITEVFQKGYMLNNKVIRVSMVKVNERGGNINE